MSSSTVAAPAPDQWWDVVAALGPVAILLAAFITGTIALLGLRQRTAADRAALEQRNFADSRAEWWRRTQWALQAALSNDPDTEALGVGVLSVLAESELAQDEELELLDIAWRRAPSGLDEGQVAGLLEGADGQGSDREVSRLRVEAAAARLRMVLDRRLGRPTPSAVQALAARDF